MTRLTCHRFCLTLALVLLIVPVTACAQDGGGVDRARAEVREGKYAAALATLAPLASASPAPAEARRLHLRTLIDVGQYAEAESAGTRYAAETRGADWLTLVGEAQASQGKVSEARASYERAIAGNARDSLTALVSLGVLRFDAGERQEAMQIFDRFIDIYNSRRASLTAPELTAIGIACRYLGRDDPQLFKDALKAFDEAIAKDSLDPEPRIRLAELFLEKYNGADAKETLEALVKIYPRHPRALLATARLRHFDHASDVAVYAGGALEVNPSLAPAHAMQALLLIDVERYADAAAAAEKGLVADRGNYDALIALAAARWLQGDTVRFTDARQRAIQRRPRSAEGDVTLSEVAMRNRLYREAVQFAREGVARDAKAARALASMGLNQLRVGEMAEGRANLDRAFALDPYDVWTKNTLDLLDTTKDYSEMATSRFLFIVETKDADLLGIYAGALAEAAYDSLAARYDYRPAPPVRVEMFRSHADFSVRTVGLAGLGALGVSFGGVVAMDSPAARPVGDFNWGSTLWHELAHTFTLGVSGNRVPRWFSEGLSVYEERRARTGWGAEATPGFIAAAKAGRLVPVARMNDGFMRPEFAEQVILSYYQASLVCELIEREHGIAGIRAMLDAYRRGRTTEQAFTEALKTDLATFQGKFDAFLRERFAKEMQGIEVARAERGSAPTPAPNSEYAQLLKAGREALAAGRTEEGIATLRRAKALFPGYAGDDSPYRLLAGAHLKAGAKREAAAELSAMTALNEDAYEANVQLAALSEELGAAADAMAALDRALWISPFDPKVHERLARLAAQTGDKPLAVRERRALVALNPVDRVEALYQLALAHMEAGDAAAARREVLRALELAPNYEKAQELLLKLRAPSPGGSQP